jgi:hypothetical protein
MLALGLGELVGMFPLVPISIVLGPFLLVGEHLIGRIYFFELLFTRLVPRIDVRMMLAGQTPVGLLYLLLGGLTGYPQDIIVILTHIPPINPSSSIIVSYRIIVKTMYIVYYILLDYSFLIMLTIFYQHAILTLGTGGLGRGIH